MARPKKFDEAPDQAAGTGRTRVKVARDGIWSSEGRLDTDGGPDGNGVYNLLDSDALLLADLSFVDILKD